MGVAMGVAGRTVLVTGAGRGIGRAEALHLAAAGANVVVNDPGVGIDGRGGDAGVAAAVADEIRRRGGRAVADTGSVADWEAARRMVALAVAEFGDLHVVVNNAATEVNKGMEALTEEEFDGVVAVKVKGSFAVSHWAARYWRERFEAGERSDRAIVNTASGSGLLNPLPTQSNYAAANAAVAAMTTVHALELKRFGVRVNCVSPSMVRTRLTAGVPAGERMTGPEVVAPVVTYLAGDGCPLTGQVLSVRGGSVAVNQGWSLGPRVGDESDVWSVEALAVAMDDVDVVDPFDALTAALGGALGLSRREDVEAVVNAQLG
ncbi:SDR family NAD(P)-dependent oxidoreductase [Lentzea sp. NPDC058450]|uniref:SDR family NAD(P)-dependent oxidoreductase n=1 Tax=Lentzea sp. NPDC058450 TaxID=3346505 RepID=UPI0036659FEF